MHEPVSPVAQTFGRDASNSTVLVADGYGIRIFVNRRHLVVKDGIGRHRRERRYARATHGLRRLVVLGHTGYVTLETHRWLADVGIAYTHLDTDAGVLTTSGPLGVDHPALRRAQALAAGAEVGLVITKELLDAKLRGQATVAQLMGAEAVASTIDGLGEGFARATDVEQCRSIEAAAAAAYWQDAWSALPVDFVRRDAGNVPDHWKIFGSRQSALATVSSPRRATNPANAVLNYVYALGEAEARLALAAVGLDPGLSFGLLHVDQRSRDSAALDVLEVIRPDIDRYVLRLLQERTWSHRDFAELRDGTCRILAPLTHELAETMPTWAELLAPVAEKVASLVASSDRIGVLSTPLTQANRSAGRPTRRKPSPRKRPARARAPRPCCQTCGATLEDSSRRVCDRCLPERRSLAGTIGRRVSQAERETQSIRADRHNRRNAARVWESMDLEEPIDRKAFAECIRPKLARVSTKAMVEATGLSASYCARIRRGPVVPHARHWYALLLVAPTQPTDACD
jgi:CRISPR-associated endonuclease Cas1